MRARSGRAARSARGREAGPCGRAVLAVLAAIASAGLAAAEPLRFDRLSREQELSQVSVADIAQDRHGFLWVATQDGLNRFDGYGFTVFLHDPAEPGSLSQNQLIDLVPARDGSLWVVPFAPGVIDRYDPATEQFRAYRHDPADPASLSPGQVVPGLVLDDRDGRLWLGAAGGGIDLLDPATGRVEHLRPDSSDPGSLASGNVSCLFEDRAGTLWIGTADAGLLRRRPGGEGVRPWFDSWRFSPDEPEGIPDDRVTALHEDARGRLWIGTAHGLAEMDRVRGTFRVVRAPDPSRPGRDAVQFVTPTLPRPILEDRAGALWVVTVAGLTRFDPETGELVDFGPDEPAPRTLPNRTIAAVLADRAGELWVATQGSGLLRYRPGTGGFAALRHDPQDPQSVGSDFLTSLFESREGVVWIGTTDAGLAKFGRLKNTIRHYARGLADDMVYAVFEDSAGALWVGTLAGGLHRFDPGRERVVERYANLPGDPRDLGADWVRAIHEDRQGRFWVGTVGGGLALLDRAAGRVARRYRNDPEDSRSLANDGVFAIDEDRAGRLWLATAGGWDLFDPESGAFTHFRNDPDDPESLVNDGTRFTVEDRAGRLWIGTNLGLSRYDPATGRFANFRHDPRRPESLANDTVMDLHEDAAGRIWVATYGGGLDLLDPSTATARQLTVRDGLPSNAIYSVLPDEDGHLWLSSNRGIARFDPASGAIETFDVGDGLQGSEFNGGAFFRSPRGELLFGGIYGVNAFFPREMRRNEHVPPVVLTAFRRLGRPERFPRPLAELAEILLSHRDRLIAFDFAALDFTHPEKNRYAYRLEGFDRNWIDIGTRRTAQFTNLDPGRYTFRVRASNGDGVWNEEGAAIRLVVVPPPWQRWWAWLGYLALAAAAVAGFLRRQEAAHREELVRQRVAAEGRRKTEELESARQLQLSLLPAAPPEIPGFEIAAELRTATEVGGDCYDFFPQPDGTLYLATGDATGHGLSAGMLVGMTQAALTALGPAPPRELLGELNRVLRRVHRGRMHMALNLAHLAPDRFTLSSAGMPPVSLYRAADRSVEELLLPGVPLGSLAEAAYVEVSRSLEPGDLLLFLSDGLAEVCDPAGRMLGYGAIPDFLAARGERPVAEIAAGLLHLATGWAGGRPPDDDITVVAIRRRAGGAGG